MAEPNRLSSTDTQPPHGSIVRDINGERWRRNAALDRWFLVPVDDEDDDPRTWTRLAGNYGPVVLDSAGQEADRG